MPSRTRRSRSKTPNDPAAPRARPRRWAPWSAPSRWRPAAAGAGGAPPVAAGRVEAIAEEPGGPLARHHLTAKPGKTDEQQPHEVPPGEQPEGLDADPAGQVADVELPAPNVPQLPPQHPVPPDAYLPKQDMDLSAVPTADEIKLPASGVPPAPPVAPSFPAPPAPEQHSERPGEPDPVEKRLQQQDRRDGAEIALAPAEPKRLIFLPLRRLKFWMWFKEKAQPSDLQLTLLWAGIVGFCGAICSIGFRLATGAVHKLLTGSPAPHLSESFAHLPLWMRLIVPGMGGLVAGAILQFGMRWHGQLTTTDYMEAVVLGDGKISTRRSLVKCLSALFIDRFRWLDWPRRSAGSTFIAGCIACRTIAKMVAAATAIARRLWRGRRYRISLQRTDCRRGLCRGDRARFCGDGNFRAARFFVRHSHADGARLPWRAIRSTTFRHFS